MARLPIEAVRMVGKGGAQPTPEHGLEAAGQTYIHGSLLIAVSGALTIAGTNPTTLVGVAIDPATGTTGTDREYIPCLQDIVFAITADQASSLGNGVVANSSLLSTFGVTKDSAGIWYLDTDKSGGNQVLLLIGFISNDVPGTTKQPRCLVTFTSKLGNTVW